MITVSTIYTAFRSLGLTAQALPFPGLYTVVQGFLYGFDLIWRPIEF